MIKKIVSKFKGSQKLSDITVTTPIVLELKTRIIHGMTDDNNYPILNEFLFPVKSFVITKRDDQGSFYQIQCYYKNNLRFWNVPKDIKVRVRKCPKLLKEYSDYEFTKVLDNIGYSGMVGSDPEIFVQDGNGNIIPAFDFLGDKKTPNLTEDMINNSLQYGKLPLYWDGFQAEFQTTPASCLAWQVDSVRAGLGALNSLAKKHNPSAKLSVKTLIEADQDVLQKAKPEHIEFGCMPSFNVYGLKGKMSPPRETIFRSTGGHIHFGIGPRSHEQAKPIVEALDAILGVACVALFARIDNPVRRQYYGLPGEYRLPAHGIEYRVLSNAWLFHPLIMNLVFDLGRKCVAVGQRGLLKHWKATQKETIETITKCDVKKAQEILLRNKAFMIKLFTACYGAGPACDGIFNVFYNGMDKIVKDITDFETNWSLNTHWVRHSDGAEKNVRHAHNTLIKFPFEITDETTYKKVA